MTALLKYDAACKAIAEAKSVDEVTAWIDKAAAVREYGRRIKNRQMEFDAVEIRVRARKRRGELLLELKEKGQLREGKKKEKLSPEDDSLPRITLDDLGLTLDESSEDQKIAKIEGSSFDRLVARCRAYAEANPAKHSFDVLKPPPEGAPINGARATMGSREEPDDSLDYFPTPPWATRALMECVLPTIGVNRLRSVWEPACGEGHIAEVLREYSDVVHASDVFDYGYGEVFDYLGERYLPGTEGVHWIITNPPFDSKALQFALTAINRDAGEGVALFVRWQWIETVGRFEKLFNPFPPTLVCPFAERVPLHKGRWEPEGDTATAYCWIVWHKKSPSLGAGLPTLLKWIPPGQREALSKPDDAARFTARPVIKVPKCDEPFDSSTGEIISGRISPDADSSASRPASASASAELPPQCTLSTASVPQPCELVGTLTEPQPQVIARQITSESSHLNSPEENLDIPQFLRRTPVASASNSNASAAGPPNES